VLLLRKLLISVALAAIVGAAVSTDAIGRPSPSPNSVASSLLLPGVTDTREVDFTSRGPIVLDVVTAPKPDGNIYSLTPALSNNQLRGKESLTGLEKRVAGGATTVAIDGDYFDNTTGTPSGIYLRDGVIESQPAAGRSSLGIEADGTLTTDSVTFAGIWQGNGQRRSLSLNTPAKSGKFTLYTPAYGTSTPRESGVVEVVIGTFPAAQLDVPLDGTVTQVTTAGPTPIPPGGAVLVARGAQSTAQLKAEAPVGQQVDVLLSLSPDWSDLASAIGGGPLLVKNGKPIFHAGESFPPRQLNGRQARGAIGQLPDGRVVLVAVEGTKPAYSIGMSNYELAVELSRLGATTAFGLGAGPAAGLAFDGKLLTRSSTGVTPKVSDALVLSYSGVYAAPPSAPVLSPNGDGAGDTESFSYRVARVSQVVVKLVGPAGAKITLADGAESAGLHSLEWDGTVQGSPAAEGKWTFTVTGTDDRKVTTSAQRTFSLDDTLSSLVLKTAYGLPRATFLLTRPAKVVVQIQRANGVPVVTLRSGQRAAGPEHASWRGRIDRHRAPAGRYQLVVQATSSVGASSLAKSFSLSAHPQH
jgi:flagellar hook assembly protein FlgD